MTPEQLRQIVEDDANEGERWCEWGCYERSLTALAPEAMALLADAMETFAALADPDISDLFGITFDWHDDHVRDGEQQADDCIICTLRAALARFSEMGDTA